MTLEAIKDALAERNQTAYVTGMHTRIRQPAHAVRVVEVCDGENVVESVRIESGERLQTVKVLNWLRETYGIEGFED